AIDHLAGNQFINEEQDIFLEDVYLGIVHNLRLSPYTFSHTAGALNDRFLMRYTNQTLSTNDLETNETLAFIHNNILKVNSSQEIKKIMVYSITGQEIVTYTVNGNSEKFESEFNYSKGVYLAIITLNDGRTVTKKLLN
ncbi:T9SS type A sorting domain-containing protein, partial [Psychroserpens sp.]